ncbi:MAG: hypothetical protein ACRD0P_11195 [Stackebrandtia sp.]
MPFSFARGNRLLPVIGLAALLCLGTAACSSGDSDAKPDAEPDKTPSMSEEDYAKLAEQALVSTDMETLSDHKPELDEPDHSDLGRPFAECQVGHGPFGGIHDAVFQSFDGDPLIRSRGLALDGSAKDDFADMREEWKSKCDSFEYDGPDTEDKWAYERQDEIKAPKGVDADSWYGACFDMTNLDNGNLSSNCHIIFVLDDERIGEVVSLQVPDDTETGAAFLTLLAAEAVTTGPGGSKKD